MHDFGIGANVAQLLATTTQTLTTAMQLLNFMGSTAILLTFECCFDVGPLTWRYYYTAINHCYASIKFYYHLNVALTWGLLLCAY